MGLALLVGGTAPLVSGLVFLCLSGANNNSTKQPCKKVSKGSIITSEKCAKNALTFHGRSKLFKSTGSLSHIHAIG